MTCESDIQSRIRLEVGRTALLPRGQQKILWRNNCGAGKLTNGSFIRWGLANDSSAVNTRIKSADLIGGEQILIRPEHIGQVMLRFWSVEVKRSDWKFAATTEECAQLAWMNLINSLGGRAIILNTDGTIDAPIT